MAVPLRQSFIATVLACASFLLCAQALARGLLAPREHNRALAEIDDRPIVFFVAKGAADACGRGCSEWIAAVGTFDSGATQRFRDFIEKLNGRDLPIFFHSRGGRIKAAVEIGYILRTRGMTAGIGKTEAKKCRVFDNKDAACQKLIDAAQSVDARLMTSEGQSHSACVEAFAGGSTRLVASRARIGVHAPHIAPEFFPGELRLPKPRSIVIPDAEKRALVDQMSRHYLIGMGIDPRLHELASQTSPKRIYVLGRDEVARFGLETRNENFETPWAAFSFPNQRVLVMKSITRRAPSEPAEYLTLRVQFSCQSDGRAFLLYRRDLAREPDKSKTDISLAFGAGEFAFRSGSQEPRVETGFYFLRDADALTTMATAKTMTVIEKKPGDGPAIETKLSTAGLEAALGEFQKRCGKPATPTVKNVSVKPANLPVPVSPATPLIWPPTPARP